MEEKAEAIGDNEKDTMKGRFLTFLIDEEVYGIEIANVTEILGLQPITKMPEMPDYIRGIVNLRGDIVLAIDARLRFKKPETEYTDRTCMIVVSTGGTSIGLIVDCVSEVLTIPDEDTVEKPEFSGGGRGYVKSIGKVGDRIVLLIDCKKLMSKEEFDAVSGQL